MPPARATLPARGGAASSHQPTDAADRGSPARRRSNAAGPSQAWQSLRKAAGLAHVGFHVGRHTALTRLAEKGQPDWVIQAQMGHVSPAMMRTWVPIPT